jgi:hypothetical protein
VASPLVVGYAIQPFSSIAVFHCFCRSASSFPEGTTSDRINSDPINKLKVSSRRDATHLADSCLRAPAGGLCVTVCHPARWLVSKRARCPSCPVPISSDPGSHWAPRPIAARDPAGAQHRAPCCGRPGQLIPDIGTGMKTTRYLVLYSRFRKNRLTLDASAPVAVINGA